jgi:hypothetical protein
VLLLLELQAEITGIASALDRVFVSIKRYFAIRVSFSCSPGSSALFRNFLFRGDHARDETPNRLRVLKPMLFSRLHALDGAVQLPGVVK